MSPEVKDWAQVVATLFNIGVAGMWLWTFLGRRTTTTAEMNERLTEVKALYEARLEASEAIRQREHERADKAEAREIQMHQKIEDAVMLSRDLVNASAVMLAYVKDR